MSRRYRSSQTVLVLVAGAAAGCGATARNGLPLSRWLSASPAQRSVILTLIPGDDSVLRGYNFNGCGRGQVLMQVPRGWRVVVRCLNTASSIRHSCAVISDSLSSRPAFPGAATPGARRGLAPGRSASFSSLASRPGSYRLACVVDDHELAGMWDAFQVGGTRVPSVRLLHLRP